MLQNKKMLVTTTIASALLVPLMATSHVHAASWHATTPAMITKLNNDGTYTVKSGDTLWAIGMHYNIKPSVIAAANGIINPNNLQVGTVLLRLSNVNHNHAILTIKKDNNISQQYLTNNDKINPSQSFNKAVTTTPATNKQVTTKTSVSPTVTTTTKTNSVTTSSSSTTTNQNNDQMVQRINSELKQVDGNAVTSYNIKKVDNDRYFVYDASSNKSNEPIWVVNAHTGAMLKA